MKSLCLSLALVALAGALVSAEQEPQRLRSLMPLLPSVEEQRRLLTEARLHPNPMKRLPAPLAGLRRTSRDKKAATKDTASRYVTKNHHALREPQPDIAGRVAVRLDASVSIINGQDAVLGQFPWQAGVYMDFGWNGKAWCGGSIVHSLWILTAAHCVDDQPDSYTISVGSLGSETGSEASRQVFKKVTETYQHPEYSPYLIDNDIGFVKLPSAIVFNAYVAPVRLPSYSMATDMMVGKTGIVSGWGKTTDHDSWISSKLKYVTNTIDDGSACFKTYDNVWIPNKICVQTKDVKSFCNGDSGGAFTIVDDKGIHRQIGIVSYGASAGCEKKLPTAYTRLASFLDFVETTTNIAIDD